MDRRNLLQAAAATAATAAAALGAEPANAASPTKAGPRRANVIVTRDGTELFYRSWGQGRPVLFDAAWSFSSQAWQYQMLHASQNGLRAIAFDRRGHGRSSDPGGGYDIDTLADDLAQVIEQLDLKDAVLIGHSLGAAEAVRYVTRHGTGRVSRLALIAPTTPYLLKGPDNPEGLDAQVGVATRTAFAQDFPGIVAANIAPFVTPATSPAMVAWIERMMSSASLQALVECNRALNAEDFRQELPRLKLPVLVLQGDADVSAPLELTGRRTAALIPGARLEVYAGAPHGLIFTHQARVNADLVAFARA
jgi:non-heme chloroperoxidase